jgi:hypothetical protein
MPIRDALGLVDRFNLELGFRFVDQFDRDVFNEAIGNVVDEREIPVLAALDAGDDVRARMLRVNDGFGRGVGDLEQRAVIWCSPLAVSGRAFVTRPGLMAFSWVSGQAICIASVGSVSPQVILDCKPKNHAE